MNINFTDRLEREYFFFKYQEIEDYFKTLEDIVGMRIKVNFKCLSLKLEHIDRSFLAEMMLQNLAVKMTKYRDYKGSISVRIRNFFIFDKIQPSKLFKNDI